MGKKQENATITDDDLLKADALAEETSFLEGTSRTLDACWNSLRRGVTATGVFLNRQKRMAWCDRAVRELRDDRDAVLQTMGKKVYRAFVDGELEGKGLEVTEELLKQCRRVEDFDTKIAAQKLLRDRIGAGTDLKRPPPKASDPAEAHEG